MSENKNAAVEADRAAQIHDNASCVSKLSGSDKQDQSGGITERIMNAAVGYADACITRAVAGCAGRPQSEQQIAAVAAEQAYADLHDLLSGQLAASIDIADVRQYLDRWGCLAHPGVRALVDRYSSGKSAAPALTIDQVLSLERRSGMTDDEAIRFARSVESALFSRAAPVAQEPTESVVLLDALSGLVKALRERHYGRMPDEVQAAYDKAWAIVFSSPVAATVAVQAQPSGNAGELPTELDDLKLAYVSACEERDHLRAALAAQPSAQDREDAIPDSDAVDLAREGMELHKPGQPEYIVCAELVRVADRAAKGADHE